jgi:serine/threonine-protein kinase PknG
MQDAVKAFPKSIEARLQVARLLITHNGNGNKPPDGKGGGKAQPAAQGSPWEKSLASIEEEDPFEWRVAWTRGQAAFHLDKPEEAAPIFNLVLNEVPGELAPRLALALAAEAANQPRDAIRFYEAVVKTDDRFCSAAFGLARCRLHSQQVEEAIHAFDRVPPSASLFKEAQIQKALTLCAKRTEDAFVTAGEIIAGLHVDGVALADVTIKILSQALEELEGKAGSKTMQPSNKKVLGWPLNINGVKTGLEKAYRQLAIFAQTPDEKIAYADLANAVRPVTLL